MKYSLLFGLTMYFITGCGDAEESSEKSQVSQSVLRTRVQNRLLQHQVGRH